MAEPRRAFVLAAGLGTRLRPLTEELPKPAWPFFDVPLAVHVLSSLRDAGVEEAIVNLHHLGDRLKEVLTPWIPDGLDVVWSPEDPILGTGGALVPWRERLSEGPFFLCNADTIQELDLAALARRHHAKGAMATLVVRPVPAGVRAPIELDLEGRIVRFLTARSPGSASGVPCEFTGVHLLEPEILDHLPGGRFCINADVHATLVANGAPVYGYAPPKDAFWSDLGTPERYLAGHWELLRRGGLPLSAPGQLVREDVETEDGARILAPSYLGPGAILGAGAVVGPLAVLGAGATVENRAEVRESVVWAGGRVRKGRTEKAILSPSGCSLSLAVSGE